jgi:murein DD-endopeptidase MepM/ murein hydrolase activator NlpD
MFRSYRMRYERSRAARAAAWILAAAFPLALASAQDGAPTVSWSPARPGQGTLFRITVQAPEAAAPSGSIGPRDRAEPLHFVRESDHWLALAPVAVDAQDSIDVRVQLEGDSARAIERRIPVAPGAFPTERLRVAPRFGRPPSATTQRRITEEARRAHEVARAAHETPRLWSGPFVAPRPSRITSQFGRGREFNGTVTSRHMGTDFAGRVGDPVRAANRGVVRLVDRFYLGGNVVYIDHGAGLTTAYLHLSHTSVAPGDTVAAGQVIGRVGATGRVTGPHLHVIARYGEVTVDPMSLLRATANRP